jgi:transmembrane sensor
MDNIYINYSLEDWIADEKYIEYVLNGSSHLLFEKYGEENPKSIPLMQEAKEIITTLAKSKDTKVAVERKEKIWENIQKEIRPQNNRIRKLVIWTSSIAALFCLIYFVNFIGKNKINEIEIASVQVLKKVNLPDHSIVSMVKNSKITYDKNSFNDSRVIKLEGQAFFDVKKGKDFIVNTKAGSIKVLGTSFNVIDQNGSFMVECFTGKVMVSHLGREVILMPGEKLDINSPSYKSTNSYEDSMPYYLIEELKFDNKSVKDIIIKINEIYNLDISVKDQTILNKKFTGTIATKDLDKALKSLTWPLFLKYEINNNANLRQVSIYK